MHRCTYLASRILYCVSHAVGAELTLKESLTAEFSSLKSYRFISTTFSAECNLKKSKQTNKQKTGIYCTLVGSNSSSFIRSGLDFFSSRAKNRTEGFSLLLTLTRVYLYATVWRFSKATNIKFCFSLEYKFIGDIKF